MSRSFLPLALVTLVALSGCSSSSRSSDSRRDGDWRSRRADARTAPDRGDIQRDVRDYVETLDRAFRLDRRAERQIREILEDRASDVVRQGRGRTARRTYPFPRRLGEDRFDSREAEAFWRDADARIERVLDRDQTREYRELTGRDDRRGRSRRSGRRN